MVLILGLSKSRLPFIQNRTMTAQDSCRPRPAIAPENYKPPMAGAALNESEASLGQLSGSPKPS
jgi:hypothetical protein